MRIVNEALQGLAFARRRGCAEARHDVVIFCDDDNHLESDYLVRAVEIMEDESIGAASGVALPELQGSVPAWFYTFAECYAVGLQVNNPLIAKGGQIDLSERIDRCPWGAGLVVRRSLLKTVFAAPNVPLLSGRSAYNLTSGDDYEICHLIRIMGKRLVVDGRLKLTHVIPPERITLEYLSALHAGFIAQQETLAVYGYVRHFFETDDRRRWQKVVRKLAKMLLGRHDSEDKYFVACALGASSFLTELQRMALANAHFVRSQTSR
jgi:glycosyltransferase involved in cell wall biosynthesis